MTMIRIERYRIGSPKKSERKTRINPNEISLLRDKSRATLAAMKRRKRAMDFNKLSPEDQAQVREQVRKFVEPLAREFVAEYGAREDEEFVGLVSAWCQDVVNRGKAKDGGDALDLVYAQEIARSCIAGRNRIIEGAVAGRA